MRQGLSRVPLLCVSLEVIDFLIEVCGLDRGQMEFFPIGGRVLELAKKQVYRSETRQELSIPDDCLFDADPRVQFLGWKDSEQLTRYNAASDLYVQPGIRSATMQAALCAGTPVLFSNVKSHVPDMQGNALAVDSTEEMVQLFADISNDRIDLAEMSERAFALARDLLDYTKRAVRLVRSG